MTGSATPFGFTFPRRIHTYHLVPDGIQDYESKSPGLGYSASYRIPDVYSRSLTLYIYDRGVAAIPDDVKDEVVKNECILSAQEIMNSAAYSEANVTDNGYFHVGAGPRFWCCFLDLVSADPPRPMKSILAMAPCRSKFVKLRMSVPSSDSAAQEFDRVLQGWSAHLASETPNAGRAGQGG